MHQAHLECAPHCRCLHCQASHVVHDARPLALHCLAGTPHPGCRLEGRRQVGACD